MSSLSQKLRELAEQLRKEATATPMLPKPIPNPVASRAKGNLGSLGVPGPAGAEQKKQPMAGVLNG